MAFLKLGLIICGVLILQTQAVSPTQDLPQAVSSVNSVIDIIKVVVKVVETIVDGALIIANKAIDELLANQDGIHEKVVVIVGKIIDGIQTIADREMNKIKNKGNEDSKIVIACIQVQEEKIKSLVSDTFNKNSRCLISELATLEETVKAIIGDLQIFQGDLKKSLSKLDSCSGEDSEAITCVVGVALETIDLIHELPGVVGKDVSKLGELLAAFPKSLLGCVKPNADVFRANILGVINDISTCIRK